MAAQGSLVGILLLDFVSRAGGEAGLERLTNRKRLQDLKRKIDKDAGYAVAIACRILVALQRAGNVRG